MIIHYDFLWCVLMGYSSRPLYSVTWCSASVIVLWVGAGGGEPVGERNRGDWEQEPTAAHTDHAVPDTTDAEHQPAYHVPQWRHWRCCERRPSSLPGGKPLLSLTTYTLFLLLCFSFFKKTFFKVILQCVETATRLANVYKHITAYLFDSFNVLSFLWNAPAVSLHLFTL